MVKKVLTGFVLGMLTSFTGWCQFGNEWIVANQQYYKISVAKTGIYRVTYTDLLTAGFPVASVDPRVIQVYHRGIEQSIFFKHDQLPADGRFDNTEFFEFFGKKNDGALDADLYQPASAQPHGHFNLFSDTSAYFLTWNNQLVPGKRMEVFFENNVTSQPKEASHTQERMQVVYDQYSAGFSFGDFTQASHFDVGEGWTGIAAQPGQSRDYVIDQVVNPTPAAGAPQLEVFLVGRSDTPHSVEVYAGPNASSLRLIGAQSFSGYQTRTITTSLSWTDIGADGRVFVRCSALASTSNRPQFSVSYIRLLFPQNFNLSGLTEQMFLLNSNGIGKSYVEWDNASASMRFWDVTDANNVISIGTRTVGLAQTAMVNNTVSPRQLFMSAAAITPSIKPVSFRQINPLSHNFLIVSHRQLMMPGGSYSNPVRSYASFRASLAGGSYDTLSVSVDQLYNQFNFGETSPRAIYQFVKYMAQGSPKYLLLIGKGRDIDSYSAYQRKPAPVGELPDLVPSAGYPASDMLYSAGVKSATHVPLIPVGRIPAATPAQVGAYLDKVREYEINNVSQPWKKNGLHLSGGIREDELPVFKSFVEGFEKIAEDKYWGANIATIAKRDPVPTELINVSDRINDGVNMVTFFGHSSPGTIDIDIGFATDPTLGYNNPGKYPTFLINGCSAGAFFLNGRIFGEDWILASKKGARNFIAHSSFGYANLLQQYSTMFYETGFSDSTFIGKGIGDVQKRVAQRFLENNGSNIVLVAQAQQMICLGDPALRLFDAVRPDFTIANQSLAVASLDARPVTIASKKFALRFVVDNLGVFQNKKINIRVKRILANNTIKQYDSLIAPVLNRDTVFFILKQEPEGAGTNRFEVSIDPENKIVEGDDLNNQATVSAVIPSNATLNLYPIDFSIVPSTHVQFRFQDTNLLGTKRNFQFELDTVPSFNSPFVKKLSVASTVLATTSVAIPSRDSVVYYWRTRFENPNSGESQEWSTSSFSFVQGGVEGWGQLRNPQLLKNELQAIQLNESSQEFSFIETRATITVNTFGSSYPSVPKDASIRINNSEYNLGTQGQPCRNNTINLIAFQKSTLVPYPGLPFIFQDPRTCGREPQVINSFTALEASHATEGLQAYVDAIAPNDSLIIFSIGDAGVATWPSAVINKLAQLGISAAQLGAIEAGEPLVIKTKKGAAAGQAKFFRAAASPANEQQLQVATSLIGRNTSGTIKSVLIGPSVKWTKLISRVTKQSSNDRAFVKILAVKPDRTETEILTTGNRTVDLSAIDAKTYPYLRLVLAVEDGTELTAAQLKKWVVQYEPAPEAILIFLGNRNQQSLQEGQRFSSSFGVMNISPKIFAGGLDVAIELITTSNGNMEKMIKEIAPPKPGDTTKIAVDFSTRNKVGLNSLGLNLNSLNVSEQYADNNNIFLRDLLVVVPDRVPPVLDVSVDGRYLVNGDIVSTNPTIAIRVEDENPYLLKDDTVGVRVFLKYPCAQSNCPFVPLYFRSSQTSWTGATSSSPFVATFRPTGLPEGEYVLKVEATDASGNKSGSVPYEVEFKVVAENGVRFLSTYPNPSRTQFNFQFLLTGNRLPDDFELSIYAADGRVVRAFDLPDVRRFFVGTNELIWDASRADGGLQESGIYFFRMRILQDGKESTQQGRLILLR